MTTHRGLALRTGIVFSLALAAAACAAPVDDTSNPDAKSGVAPVKGGSGSDLATGLGNAGAGATGGGGATGTGGDPGVGGGAAGGSAGNAGAAGTGGGSTGEPGLVGYWP